MVFDGGISRRRRSIYAGYKANRGRTSNPDHSTERVVTEGDDTEQNFLADFVNNKNNTKYLMRKLGVKVIEIRGREADDVIAFITRQAVDVVGECCIVVSEDNDMLQLVSPKVHVYKPISERYVTWENFVASVPPWPREKFLLAKAILGDGGDGIPGIKGVGWAAINEVLQFCSNTDEVQIYCEAHHKKKFKDLAAAIDNVRRNELLIDLHQEQFDQESQDMILRTIKARPQVDLNKAIEALTKLEIHSLLSNFHVWVNPFNGLM